SQASSRAALCNTGRAFVHRHWWQYTVRIQIMCDDQVLIRTRHDKSTPSRALSCVAVMSHWIVSGNMAHGLIMQLMKIMTNSTLFHEVKIHVTFFVADHTAIP
ncbi:MAG TPA: hypothetical protein VF469_01425, partial [Kofleriaceae bacterium]